MTSLSPPMRSSLESRRIHLTAAPVAVLSIASILRTGGGDRRGKRLIPAATDIATKAANQSRCDLRNMNEPCAFAREGERAAIVVGRGLMDFTRVTGLSFPLANNHQHARSSARLRLWQAEDDRGSFPWAPKEFPISERKFPRMNT